MLHATVVEPLLSGHPPGDGMWPLKVTVDLQRPNFANFFFAPDIAKTSM